MKRALKRLGKEDLVGHTSSDLASLLALGESLERGPPTRNKKLSSSSIDDTLYDFRTVRRILDTHDSATAYPVSRKTIPSQNDAANDPTASPTKTPSRKSYLRKLQRSLDDAADSALFETLLFALSIRDSNNFGKLLERNLQNTVNETTKKYPLPLEDLSMKIGCDERHVTTWDEPDHAFYLFPAQLLIACTSTHDFDPLLVPAVTLVHLICSTVAMNGPYKSHNQISFKTFYDGATIRYINDTPTPDLSRGIHIGEVPWCSTKDGDGKIVGWCMRFWIPIPYALFQRAETRTFKIDAKVHVEGDEGKEGYLSASNDFTLSRLLRGLAM